MTTLVGIDEVGRGCLAGPVFACAAALPPGDVPAAALVLLDDSKRLSPARRRRAAEALAAAPYALGAASVAEVETLNVRRATHLAMRRAHRALLRLHPKLAGAEVVVDGADVPDGIPGARAAPRADAEVPEVSAASILAKTARDAAMARLAWRRSGYGFERNAGYGTPEHLAALRRLGPCSAHRPSFLGRVFPEGPPPRV